MEILLGLGVFLLAFALRLIYVLQARANPQFDAPLMDPGYHDQWAWQVASGAWEPVGAFFRAPLYPLFLAAVYAIGGHDYLLPRLVQAVLGSLSCVLVYLIGKRLFSRTTGLLAGLAGALCWILIYFDNELLIPVLLVFLVLAFFYALIRALDGWMWGSTGGSSTAATVLSAVSGALYGLATITRPNVLVFLPVLAWAFHRCVKRGFPLRAVLVFALATVVPIACVTVYNATAGRDFVIIASQGGVNFYIGNNAAADGHTAVVPGTRSDWWGGRFDTIKIAEREAGRTLKDSEVSSYWFRQGLRFVVERPGRWLTLTARKFALFWSAAEIGNNSSIYHLRSYASLMRLPLLGFGLLAPLALAGAYLALRRRRGQDRRAERESGHAHRERALLLLLLVVLYMGSVVAFFVCARYRVPIVPFLLIFAAYALTEAFVLWKSRDRGALVAAAAIFLVAAIAVNVPALSRRENIAQARFHDGIAWKKKGNLSAAEQAFRDALRRNPTLAEARSNLGNLLAQQGAGTQARAEYERAIAANPRNAKTYANLASFHLEAGDLAAAESTVDRALAIDADFSPALRILGVIRERQGNLSGAREAYTRALRFTSERHRLENNLGVVAMKAGRTGEAEEHLRRSVDLDPSYAMAWGNLGVLLAETGRPDEAVKALAQAAALQPDAPTAWLQLAEVLNRMGRTAEAAEARRRAAAARSRDGKRPERPPSMEP
jgi:tetratricopeptide (TPR) repeat protein